MIPCPDCCPSCLVATDSFSTDTIADYSTTGSPTITGGVLVLNTSDGAAHNTAAASEDDATRVTFTIDTAETNATIRGALAWSDWSNYLYGEIEKAGSTWTILVGRRVAGTDEEYTAAVEITAPTLPATVCLSWHPGETQPSESFIIAGVFPSEVSDNGGGLGSWASVNNVLADDGSNATYTFTSTGSGQSADALVVRWAGLAVPPGSIIDGIAVTVQVTGGGGLYNVIDEFAQLESGLGTYDNKATGGAFGTAEERTYGGSTDNWGGVTWEDLPTLAFLFVLKRAAAFTGGNAVVDYVGEISIWFTTPERTPGRLRLSINGECVTEYSAENPDGGLKAGVRSQAGDWDVDDFDYQYALSDARPTCPTCECDTEDAEPCPCCDPDFPPAAAYVLDFGAASLSDDECGFCDEIAGEIEVQAAASCLWAYSQAVTCNPPSYTCTPQILEYQLSLVSDGSDCFWRARVNLIGLQDPGDTCGVQQAIYESANLSSGEDCQTLPVTLNLVSSVNDYCGGAWPATIALEAV